MADEDKCEVCEDPTSRTSNQILYCDGEFKDGTKCDMPVHQACYGVPVIPESNWYCDRCTALRHDKLVDIVCCPMQTGAIKRTQHSGKFMHVVCASFHKDVKHERFPYYYINKNIDTQQCYKCMKRQGLCLKCSVTGCDKYFHATCGVHAGIISVGYPMPIGDPVRCLDHQNTHVIDLSGASLPSSSSSSTPSSSSSYLAKRPSPSLKESPSKMLKNNHFNNENTNDNGSNLFIRSRSNSISSNGGVNVNNTGYGSSNTMNNGQIIPPRRPSLAIKSKPKFQQQSMSSSSPSPSLSKSISSMTNNSSNDINNSFISSSSGGLVSSSRSNSLSLSPSASPPIPSLTRTTTSPPPTASPPSASSSLLSSAAAASDEIIRLKKELANKQIELNQLKTKVEDAKKEEAYKQSETSYLSARLEDAKKDMKKALEKAAESKTLEKRLDEANGKMDRMHRELQQQKDFKKVVTDIFMTLNLRLANNTAPSPHKMDEYVRLLRDTLSRTGPPGEHEWLQIINLANKLAMEKR
ncbi:hypothetical protein BDA99DRAFT_514686, partial [Phascolomyces articulosus]